MMTVEGSWKSSILYRLLMIGIGCWIILAIVFGLYDLDISKAIVDRTNPFGIFGADYGEGPGYGIIGIAVAILIGSTSADLKKQKIGAFILSAIAIVVLIVGIILNEEDLLNYGGFIGTMILGFTLVTLDKDWRSYRTLALIVVLLAIINPVLFVSVTKPLCGRIRYRELLNIGFEYYTPWYLPPGPSLDHFSFPSGHTAMGWMFLPLLIAFRNTKLPVKALGSIVVIGWGAFVGFSRILVGAHFASDVLFSTGVAFVAIILLYKKFYLK
ncbi:MAG: phosphatase PAP2 family protein [Promethearchaeota archaeon]|nr:MAG: phosphatase PAP2 family protein [Candidatus Lokiarchaeota archaeon]